jgi:hypothetical protein
MCWSIKIARPIILSDGTKLLTLGDGIEALINNFANAEPASIDSTIALMVTADGTGKAADIKDATDQLEFVLRARGLMV